MISRAKDMDDCWFSNLTISSIRYIEGIDVRSIKHFVNALSGAVADYLETMGIQGGVEAVKQVVAKHYEQSWADASKTFLAQSDWPGGERIKICLD
jgi:hypothetical protein